MHQIDLQETDISFLKELITSELKRENLEFTFKDTYYNNCLIVDVNKGENSNHRERFRVELYENTYGDISRHYRVFGEVFCFRRLTPTERIEALLE